MSKIQSMRYLLKNNNNGFPAQLNTLDGSKNKNRWKIFLKLMNIKYVWWDKFCLMRQNKIRKYC